MVISTSRGYWLRFKEKFAKGYLAVKPYLRVTPQPNLHH